jgi:hypothetical protein
MIKLSCQSIKSIEPRLLPYLHQLSVILVAIPISPQSSSCHYRPGEIQLSRPKHFSHTAAIGKFGISGITLAYGLAPDSDCIHFIRNIKRELPDNLVPADSVPASRSCFRKLQFFCSGLPYCIDM